MAKKVKAVVKLQIPAGKANPAPPIGPALAQHGINLMGFCKEYNAKTSNRIGEIVPAEITIFQDGSFRFRLMSPPTSFLIKREAGIEKGASNPITDHAGTLSREQVRKIAQVKMDAGDTNALNMDAMMKQIEGTCRQMGVHVVD
ncbi:MAG: 50S ribosomal protein L11 [Anaerolineae bacterium]|nr:50S ribosomal protein L11 [Anaerolineae bacterium]MDQ7033980.1 50S ribosomal protein L11 [Anaerolineae bacterium]